jgi:hypothetical protein
MLRGQALLLALARAKPRQALLLTLARAKPSQTLLLAPAHHPTLLRQVLMLMLELAHLRPVGPILLVPLDLGRATLLGPMSARA